MTMRGIETGTAKTEGLGAEHESPSASAAPKTSVAMTDANMTVGAKTPSAEDAIAFLRGEKDWNGFWFGDRKPMLGRKVAFWWRREVLPVIESALSRPTSPLSSAPEREATSEQIEAWLTANCGTGLPHGEVTDMPGALRAIAYVHRQIASTNNYKVHIGQCVSAVSGLQFVLEYFARLALHSPQPNEGQIPAGMVHWHGHSQPVDWDGGPVLCRGGTAQYWCDAPASHRWNTEGSSDDILAYTPKASPQPNDAGLREALRARTRELLALLQRKHESVHPSNRDRSLPLMVKLTYGDLADLMTVCDAALASTSLGDRA